MNIFMRAALMALTVVSFAAFGTPAA